MGLHDCCMDNASQISEHAVELMAVLIFQ